ncbi:MAG: hypothetical protein AB7P02_17870 [Alphaproteobacteria bacterium]
MGRIRKPLLPLGVHRSLPRDRDVVSYRAAVVGRRREVVLKLAMSGGAAERVFLPGTLAGKLADLLDVAVARRGWPDVAPADDEEEAPGVAELLRRRPSFTARDRARDDAAAAFEPADLELHARADGFVVGFGDRTGLVRAFRFPVVLAQPLRRTLRHALDRGGAIDLRTVLPATLRPQ